MRRDNLAYTHQRETGVAILISDKATFTASITTKKVV